MGARRGIAPIRHALLAAALGTAALGGARAAEPPLSFEFLAQPPGTLVAIDDVRLHLACRGPERGTATVLFEAGLGGSALEWEPVAARLPADARVCSYDRAGYGWSDPSWRYRDAGQLAGELDALLDAARLAPPFVLVAHSFGGFVDRLLAELRPADIGALVLVDASHEEQFTRLAMPGERRMLPRGGQFVISTAEPPAALPAALRRKVAALGRMRKSYNATHGEMAGFARSAEQVRAARAARGAPFPFPVVVLRRGRDLYAGRASGAAKTAAWAALQEDLATLGTGGRVVVAETSGHHVHVDDPALVAREIVRVLDGLRVSDEGWERVREAPADAATVTATDDGARARR